MKTILVPTDFSAQADYALDVALVLAGKLGASVLLVHVIQSLYEVKYAATADLPEEGRKRLHADKENAEHRLQELIQQRNAAGVTIHPVVSVESVFADIADIILHKKADLIVMGTKGDSGLHEMVIGSNAEKIVRQASCPVLTVHARPENFTLRHIVFPTDFDERAGKLLTVLKSWQQLFACTIHLLYVNTTGSHHAYPGIENRMKQFMEKHRDVNLVPVIIDDHSEREGIRHYAEKVNADLIAMYTHGRDGLAYLLSGSITGKIVNRVNIPVLTYNIHASEFVLL